MLSVGTGAGVELVGYGLLDWGVGEAGVDTVDTSSLERVVGLERSRRWGL